MRPGRFHSISPEAASLIASLLNPVPSKRPTATEALASRYDTLPLPCDSAASMAKTVHFLVVIRYFGVGDALQHSDMIQADQVEIGKAVGHGSFGCDTAFL